MPFGVPEIDVLEARRQLIDGADAGSTPVLVDVREVGEFVAVRVPGSALLPMSTILPRLDELPRDRELLFICRSGSRSGQVVGYLTANGWTNVANVGGGMIAWERAGLPVRHGPPAPGEGALPGR